ncbi:hypothetical protein WN51_02828 [Melipona quadrifasciata]|uniref:Uncharacterized protein n=1 Tax=Melipona quadrifasciata TaxID=166423 RepID=A0A0N0BJS1_9HYME|nr:hypothetical protein WN51_02828 [Melipona quadrifasciata]
MDDKLAELIYVSTLIIKDIERERPKPKLRRTCRDERREEGTSARRTIKAANGSKDRRIRIEKGSPYWPALFFFFLHKIPRARNISGTLAESCSKERGGEQAEERGTKTEEKRMAKQGKNKTTGKSVLKSASLSISKPSQDVDVRSFALWYSRVSSDEILGTGRKLGRTKEPKTCQGQLPWIYFGILDFETLKISQLFQQGRVEFRCIPQAFPAPVKTVDHQPSRSSRIVAEQSRILHRDSPSPRTCLETYDTSTGTAEWTYPSAAPSYPAPPVSSGGSFSPIPGGAFSYPGEALSHHPTTEPVPLPTVLPSDSQQDTYTPNCVSMYPSHGTSSASLPLVPTKPSDPDIFAGSGTGSGSPGYHYGSWTSGPATPVPVASHNYNPNYQGYYNNPSQNYISPAPMVLYPQLYSTVNQNQIHLHLHGDLSEEQVTIAGSNLTISSNRLEIGVMGEENEQRNDVWRPY